MNKQFWIGLIVVALIAIGGYFYPQISTRLGAVSLAGTYTNVLGTWTTVITPAAPGGTTTAILNTGASDRAIESTVAFCSTVGTAYTGYTGVGLINWTLSVSTSTSASSGTGNALSNTNYVFNGTIATSTPNTNIASTSPGAGIGDVTRIWPAGTYLNFLFNATNTASCTVGVTGFPL